MGPGSISAFTRVFDALWAGTTRKCARRQFPLKLFGRASVTLDIWTTGPVMNSSAAQYRLGVDVGGTHTDLVLLDAATGEVMVEKVASTPRNPALGVLDGVARFAARGIAPGSIAFFAHGTTITTNALLEMRGAKVGLLITQGFRAVQEIQNQARDGNLFDYFHAKPPPIAPQSLTREIPERSDYAGNVLLRLDPDAGLRAVR